MDELTLEVKLKRARLARDYWRQIPPEKVCPRLSEFVSGEGFINGWVFEDAVGLDALQCEAVACLGGWLITMPEAIKAYGGPGRSLISRFTHLIDWLGVPLDQPLFAQRRPNESGTDWEVALKRLDDWIAELEREVACGR